MTSAASENTASPSAPTESGGSAGASACTGLRLELLLENRFIQQRHLKHGLLSRSLGRDVNRCRGMFHDFVILHDEKTILRSGAPGAILGPKAHAHYLGRFFVGRFDSLRLGMVDNCKAIRVCQLPDNKCPDDLQHLLFRRKLASGKRSAPVR